MILNASRAEASQRHYSFTLPNGTGLRVDTYLGTNQVAIAGEGGGEPSLNSNDAYPMACLVDQDPGSSIEPHFHEADQFQLFTGGEGRIGTHPVQPFVLHYAARYSPYGPIVAGSMGLNYVTFRNGWDPGAQWMPGASATLRALPDRVHRVRTSKPFQPRSNETDSPVTHTTWTPVIVEEEDGLGAWLIRIASSATVTGPNPAQRGGQFWYGLGGIAIGKQGEVSDAGCVFISREEDPIAFTGGQEGATLLLMQFPADGMTSL